MNKKINETVFITGVTGQAGSYLSELLLSKGYKVIGMKRRTSLLNSSERIDHIFNNPNFKLEYGNLTDSSSLYNILTKYKPDYIINCGAQSHVRVSFECPEETAEVTGLGVLKLLEAYKTIVPNAKFINFSSSEMYGRNTNIPFDEHSTFLPASPYACAKVYAHNICENYKHSYGLHISSAILFNYESPRRGETFVTKKITQAVARIKLGLQNKITLGNLDALRDWGYCPDYMHGIHLMMQQKSPENFVFATGETHTVKEFLEETFSLAGLDHKQYLSIDQRLYRPEEVPLLLGNYTKAKSKLGWEPKTKFKELVKIMYNYDLIEQSKEKNNIIM